MSNYEQHLATITVPILVDTDNGGLEKAGESVYILNGEGISNDLRTTLKALNQYYEWLDEEGMHECLMEFINKRWEEKWGGMFSWGSVNE